jgi:transcription elongation factor Elf1
MSRLNELKRFRCPKCNHVDIYFLRASRYSKDAFCQNCFAEWLKQNIPIMEEEKS